MLTKSLTYSLLIGATTNLNLIQHTSAAALAPPPTSLSLSKRENIELRGGGTITGTFADSLTTFGLSTCPGMAALGVSPCEGCTMKIVTHVLCGLDWENYLNGFVQAYTAANLGFPLIALAVVNPDLTGGSADVQRDINLGCFRAAANLLPPNEKWRILHLERQSLEGGEEDGAGELKITDGDPAIVAEGSIVMNPNPMNPAPCSWPVRYLRSDASQDQIRDGIAEANQICVDWLASEGVTCSEPEVAGCDIQAIPEGKCGCLSVPAGSG